MAEAASPSAGSSGVATMAEEKQHPSLIQRVETMASVIELLLGTLEDLSDKELWMFKEALSETHFDRRYSNILWWHPTMKDMQDTVFLMVLTDGQQSVEKTKEVLKTMNRTDLVQRLSDSSSGPKKKHSVDEHLSALIHKVATMRAIKELLLETLNDLSSEELTEFRWLLQFTFFQRNLPLISWSKLPESTRADLVEKMVEKMIEMFGQQSVAVTEEIFMDMNRTDLVQRLSEISSGPKEKHCVDEHWPALTQEVETMASVIELLLETLKDLSVKELRRFKVVLRKTDFVRHCIPWWHLEITDMQDTVFLMVQIEGQRSVEKTKEVLKTMKRTDLVQRLSDSSSGPKKKHSDEHRPALIQKVATIAAVRNLLLETLKHLSNEEIKKFNEFLQSIVSQKNLPYISLTLSLTSDRAETVDELVQTYGLQSVELTREVLQKMNKTDLMQMLSKPSSGLKEKQSVDEHQPAVSERVTIAAVKQILLETLKDLKDLMKFKRLLQFTFFKKSLPYIPFEELHYAHRDTLVGLMVKTCGQQSVEVTREVLMDMNRTDLVERLSEISSGLKEKQHPSLIQRVETMASVIELLLGTLEDLSDKELWMFKEALSETHFDRRYSNIPRWQPTMKDMQDTVFLMVQTDGQQSVEKTKEVLKTMNRTDLVQRLSDSSSGPKKKHSVDEHLSALIHKVATMRAVKELLLETLNDLSSEELHKFKWLLQFTFFQRNLPLTSWSKLLKSTRADLVEMMVEMMVEMYGQQSVELTEEIFMDMNRTDLVQRLSETSSGPKEKHCVDEHWPALTQEVETVASVIELLLETLKDLSVKELERFKVVLRETDFPRRYIPWWHLKTTDMQDVVFFMVRTEGQQSVERTKEILKTMKRTDLVQRLSDSSSGPKKKHSDEHRPALIQKVATIPAVRNLLLKTLNHLSNEEIKKFEEFLQSIVSQKNLPHISLTLSLTSDRAETVDQLLQTYGLQSVELTGEVLQKMNKTDLMQMLSKPSSGLKGPSRSLEPEAGGSVMQDSSDWTKLEPEVNSPDADESPTYSLQSDAGNFECGVSGLRWVCKQKVSFKYQFCSWEEPMERMESIKYMAAGPLIDIKVIAGKLDEVYLPHWICIHDNPTLLDKFAVLHIDDCGDVVEKVSEVTSSHVKLSEPVFSLKAVLMKFGLPVKINCNVLIYYKPNTPYLILHVYLIPRDPALQQTLDKKKRAFKIIEKPQPDKYLKMQQGFNLTADIDTATILPEKITLRYDSQDPNFYEVYIENPDRNFHLTLSHLYKRKGEQQREPVWNHEIRTVDYQNSGESEAAESTGPCDGATVRVKKTGGQSSIPGSSDSEYQSTGGPTQEKHSVEEHLSELMQKEATITTDRGRLLKMLENLKQEEFEGFKWNLQDKHLLAGLPCIPRHLLEKSDRFDLVNLMLQTYSQQYMEVAKKVFKEIYRNDLVQELSDTSSGSKAAGSSA